MLEDPARWPGPASPTFLTSMVQPLAYNADFMEFVRNNSTEGVNIEDEKFSYIAFEHLEEYWAQDDLMQHAFNQVGQPISANWSTIRHAYIRIWSTLVFSGKPQFIEWFIKNDHTDDRLPGNLGPITSDSRLVNDMLCDFDREHWQFMPLLFHEDSPMYDRPLDRRHILPITFEDRLTPADDDGKTVVWKVRLHDSCSDFGERTVVFKIYDQDPPFRAAYNRERKLLANLPSEASEVIVNYFGSFQQQGKSVIILEFASGGNLNSFLERAETPADRHDFYNLWTSLTSLLIAIYHLNNLAFGKGCAHRDIKFENILVFPGSTGSTYDFTLKLTDFDTISDIQDISPENGSRQFEDGCKVYCSPEASRFQKREQFAYEIAPLSCDIWSLGAVFSEIIVWLAEGFPGITAFEAMRKTETSNVPGLPGSGYENCFHNGLERLKCVGEVHERALGHLRKMDDITPYVKDVIERFMLVPHSQRIDPKSLHRFFNFEIQRRMQQGAEQDRLQLPAARGRAISSDSPRLPPDLPPLQTRNISLNQTRPHTALASTDGCQTISGQFPNECSTPIISNNPSLVTPRTINAKPNDPQLPSITVEDANAWLASKRRYPIPGMKEVLRDIKDRDQLFVVDDSRTMMQHKSHLYLTIMALLAFACQIDPDRVEIVFTSDPNRVIRDKMVRGGAKYLAPKVLDHFDNGLIGDSTNMESKLGDILRSRRVSWTKKTSIYVMTDAVWQPSTEPGGGVERTLKNLIRKLKRHGKDRHFITLQFIRFGDDPIGLKRLRYLDDDLAQTPGMEDYDIVDYREHDENVPHMLMGAYSPHYDAQDGHVDPHHRGLTMPQETPDVRRRRSILSPIRIFGG